MEILSIKKTQEITRILKDIYGLELGGIFLLSGSNKIRYFEGDIDIKSINNLFKNINVESVGIYFGKLFNGEIRLSFDSANLFKDRIMKNIIEISKEEMDLWFKGNSLHKDAKDGFYIIKHGKDIIGCAKLSNSTIYNYVPKEKRFRKGII
ncbi:hypothetical protein HYV49_00200 [Candidatus Pacearchaeota archaeon]|nr:hypothetical protein [Candidatus Pacearchaeota archaeon]